MWSLSSKSLVSTQTLIAEYPQDAPEAVIATYNAKAHHDYGGHYHVMKLLGWLQYGPGYDVLVNDALNNVEPQFQKSRMGAAIALGELSNLDAIPHLKKCFSTSNWALKYSSLLALETLGNTDGRTIACKDSDPIVSAKAISLGDSNSIEQS